MTTDKCISEIGKQSQELDGARKCRKGSSTKNWEITSFLRNRQDCDTNAAAGFGADVSSLRNATC